MRCPIGNASLTDFCNCRLFLKKIIHHGIVADGSSIEVLSHFGYVVETDVH